MMVPLVAPSSSVARTAFSSRYTDSTTHSACHVLILLHCRFSTIFILPLVRITRTYLDISVMFTTYFFPTTFEKTCKRRRQPPYKPCPASLDDNRAAQCGIPA